MEYGDNWDGKVIPHEPVVRPCSDNSVESPMNPSQDRTTVLTGTLCLAARIEGVWQHVMHNILGYRDFCESTTEFCHIDYAYTKDAPPEVIERGEALWNELFVRFGGADDMGTVRLTTWGGTGLDSMPKTPGPGGPGVMACITRRRALWDK